MPPLIVNAEDEYGLGLRGQAREFGIMVQGLGSIVQGDETPYWVLGFRDVQGLFLRSCTDWLYRINLWAASQGQR